MGVASYPYFGQLGWLSHPSAILEEIQPLLRALEVAQSPIFSLGVVLATPYTLSVGGLTIAKAFWVAKGPNP